MVAMIRRLRGWLRRRSVAAQARRAEKVEDTMSETGCDACREIGPLLVAPGTSGRSWQCGRCRTTWSHADPAKPWEPRTPSTTGEEAARAEIAWIIATSDDGADMLDEMMSGPVAALVAAARGPVLGEERAEYEAAEIRLRDELDEDEALSAVQLLVAEGWRPPGAVAALVAAAEQRGARERAEIERHARLLASAVNVALAWHDGRATGDDKVRAEELSGCQMTLDDWTSR